MGDQDHQTDFGNSCSVDDLLFKFCTRDTERSWRDWFNTSRAVNASRKVDFLPGLEFLPPTPLYFTSYYGIYRMTERLLDHGQDLNAKGGDFGAPLNASCLGGHTEVARLLLDRGAEINRKSHHLGMTALHLASQSGNVSLVRLLLDRGASVDIKDENGESPFVYACKSGECEIMELLLELGASIEKEDLSLHNPLMAAVIGERHSAIKFLLDRGADINQIFSSTSALHHCAYQGRTETAALLLDRGANIDIENSERETPLILAVQSPAFKMVRFLIERGADVFVRDNKGVTPLEYAQTRTGRRWVLEAKHELIDILTQAEEAQRRKHSTEPNQQDSTGSRSVRDVTTKAEETQESI